MLWADCYRGCGLILGLVAAEVMGQSSVSTDGLAVTSLYSQHLSSMGDKFITTWSMDFIVRQMIFK